MSEKADRTRGRPTTGGSLALAPCVTRPRRSGTIATEAWPRTPTGGGRTFAKIAISRPPARTNKETRPEKARLVFFEKETIGY